VIEPEIVIGPVNSPRATVTSPSEGLPHAARETVIAANTRFPRRTDRIASSIVDKPTLRVASKSPPRALCDQEEIWLGANLYQTRRQITADATIIVCNVDHIQLPLHCRSLQHYILLRIARAMRRDSHATCRAALDKP
jgi:hypothetical protein